MCGFCLSVALKNWVVGAEWAADGLMLWMGGGGGWGVSPGAPCPTLLRRCCVCLLASACAAMPHCVWVEDDTCCVWAEDDTHADTCCVWVEDDTHADTCCLGHAPVKPVLCEHLTAQALQGRVCFYSRASVRALPRRCLPLCIYPMK